MAKKQVKRVIMTKSQYAAMAAAGLVPAPARTKTAPARKQSANHKRAPRPAERKYADIYTPRKATKESGHKRPKPGIMFARAVKCAALSKGDPDRAAHVARKMYDDRDLYREIKAMSATSPSGGGYFVPEVYADEIIPLLYANAAVAALGATRIDMPNGNINLPKIKGGATSAYVGENRKSKAAAPDIGNVHLSARKLVTKVPVSNDLLRSAAYSADEMILNDMTRQMALKMDWAAMFGTGTEFVPKGLNSIKDVQRQTFGALPTADIVGDMQAKLRAKDVAMRSCGWIINGDVWGVLYNLKSDTGIYLYRDEMRDGKLDGHPFIISNQIGGKGAHGSTQIFFGDWSEFIIGEQMAFEVLSSDQASYSSEDGEMISAFDTDQTVIRIIGTHDFGVRHEEAFVIADDVWVK